MVFRMMQRFRDMQTTVALCRSAERHALDAGQEQPGSEHFLLAALELPDGSARNVFSRFGADSAELRSAINEQYVQSLAQVGIDAAAEDVLQDQSTIARRILPPPARASGIELLTRLSEKRGRLPKDAPLSGALIVAAIAHERHSVAARALRAMNVDSTRLADAALAVVNGL
jgi:ATP-dependent Clp protease ATP-binding subunit ClpA